MQKFTFIMCLMLSVKAQCAQKNSQYRCNIGVCLKRFSTQGNLTQHVQKVHRGKKNFKCRWCEKKFSTRGAYVGHERNVHTHTLVACSRCFQRFSMRGDLASHSCN